MIGDHLIEAMLEFYRIMKNSHFHTMKFHKEMINSLIVNDHSFAWEFCERMITFSLYRAHDVSFELSRTDNLLSNDLRHLGRLAGLIGNMCFIHHLI